MGTCRFNFCLAATLWLAAGLARPTEARAAPGQRLQTRLIPVERLLDAWQVDEAEQLLAPLVQSSPHHPRVRRLQADLLFYRGRYAEALHVLDETIAAYPGLDLLTSQRALIAKTMAATKGYRRQRSKSGHFEFLTLPGKDELLLPFAEETLDAMRTAITTDLGYTPPDTMRVEFYPSAETLAEVSPLTQEDIERSGTIALCKYNRIMLVSPRALLRGYSWLDTLAHEFVHLIITRISENTVPIWLHEGLAKHFEGRWRDAEAGHTHLTPGQRHLLAEALRKDRLIGWSQMHPSMAKLPSQEATALAFAQVQTAVEFLATFDKLDGLRKAIRLMRLGQSSWQAVRAVTGLDRTEFTTKWRAFLHSKDLKALAGLRQYRRRFGKAPTVEQRLKHIREKRGQKLLRIAEMLRQRHFTKAAVEEYQKAREIVGPRDDFVANSLARTYLELGKPEDAVKALDPVLEYYPELPGPQVTMGLALLEAGQAAAARTHLEAALRLNPFDPELHCGLARALESLKEATGRVGLHDRLCRQLQ